MNPFWLLLSSRGRIGRLGFVIGMAATCGLFAAAIHGSLAALPWMAEVLAPHGINAAFALNSLWIAAGALAVWSVIALTGKRLRDRGHWPWWGGIAIVPLAAVALLNDAVFLASRSIALPSPLLHAITAAAGIVAVCVLVECLLPGRRNDERGPAHTEG